jgi:tripartite-type tricarboxylate transporter receptor subunit TctC
VGNAAEQVLAGKIKALGVMAEKRYPDLPDVPTLKEQGYDVISDSSRGIVAPKGIPDEVAQKLGDAFRKISQDPEFVEDMRKAVQPMDVKILNEYDAYIKTLVKRFTELYEVNPWGKKK